MPGDHLVYVLTLTSHSVELHKYSTAGLSSDSGQSAPTTPSQTDEILSVHLPTNLQEALRYDALDGQLQPHRSRKFLHRRYHPLEQEEPELLESEDSSPRKEQKYLRRYLREVDNAIIDLLKDSNAPLQLSGDRELCELYREISEYPHLEAQPQNPQS